MFKLGQRVTCIDASGLVARNGETFPVKGKTYTVRWRSSSGECIKLREIVNPPAQYQEGLMECAFKASRFKRGK